MIEVVARIRRLTDIMGELNAAEPRRYRASRPGGKDGRNSGPLSTDRTGANQK